VIVYFIQHAHAPNGPVKIGRAMTLEHRTKALRDFPHGMLVLGYLEGDRELEILNQFSSDAIGQGGREWFFPTPRLIQFILAEAISTPAERVRLRSMLPDQSISSKEASRIIAPKSRAESICTLFWRIDQRTDEFDLTDEIVTAMEFADCGGDCADDDPEWHGPNTDCPRCAATWAIEEILVSTDFLIAIGLHEDRKEIWLFLKAVNSGRRRDHVEFHLLNCFFGLNISGWWLCGIATDYFGRECSISWSELASNWFESAQANKGLSVFDAFVDWLFSYMQSPEGPLFE
jgi:hypothetical protein